MCIPFDDTDRQNVATSVKTNGINNIFLFQI